MVNRQILLTCPYTYGLLASDSKYWSVDVMAYLDPATMETTGEVEKQINRIIDSPSTSFWLKDAFKELMQRDCLDAAGDAELLGSLLGRRADLILRGR